MDEHTPLDKWPVVGHKWAVELLQSSLTAGRQPHAMLFTGPPRVGKRTLALALAAAINCTAGGAKPCGQCRSCQLIARGVHPDVRVVQADGGESSREGVLKIDQIRELQRAAALAPIESPFRVFVLREIERANLPAANALLKTLEEPPAQVVLLLTSARPHALLPTIVSRCQVLALRPLPLAKIAHALVDRWGASPEDAELLSRLSEGHIGWAVERLKDSAARDERARRLADAQHLPRQGRLQRLTYAEALTRSPASIHPTLMLWMSWWRDLLLIQQGCGRFVSNADRLPELEQQALSLDPAQVRQFVTRLHKAPNQLNQNANARLLLETLLLHMPAVVASSS
jgi:DNA polymerase-3 subunit delta'